MMPKAQLYFTDDNYSLAWYMIPKFIKYICYCYKLHLHAYIVVLLVFIFSCSRGIFLDKVNRQKRPMIDVDQQNAANETLVKNGVIDAAMQE